MCQKVNQQMFDYYKEHSQEMQAKITELSEVLERSSQLSKDLEEASKTLKAINQHVTEH